MPHLSLEYSANIDGDGEVDQLCRVLHRAMLATGLFELGAVRVRAIRCESYCIADLIPENAFVDMSLRIGSGRSQADKKRAGDMIFEAAAAQLKDRLAQPHFALSLEIREIDAELSWKRNAIHPRVRKEA